MPRLKEALRLLDTHYEAFTELRELADSTKHPVPCDTRAYSQILVSLLTDIQGLAQQKGPDLEDGSDVKAALCWTAIDVPRFNGVLMAGRVGRPEEGISYLDEVPHLFFVLWDHDEDNRERCRVWCVRPQVDSVFREVAGKWYQGRADGSIKSSNFQLHPPINNNRNVVTNRCGNMELPLLYCAVRGKSGFKRRHYEPAVLDRGRCSLV